MTKAGWGGYVAFGALIAVLVYQLPALGNPALWGVSGLLVLGAWKTSLRQRVWRIAFSLLLGLCIALMLALLWNRFDIRYVWLYSSEALPVYLKLANLWGGDEGTILLLTALFMPPAFRYARRGGLEGCSSALIGAWYAATAAWLGPFTATPQEWLTAQNSQGMNAHLQTIWMLLHAPLILAAYAWALTPVGSAIQALSGKDSDYAGQAAQYGRRAWLVLSAGIGFGMIWALEDFTFGQLWHWDPVQTSAFIIWALLGAVLHGVRHWRGGGSFARLLPLLSLLVAVATCMAMAVTRSEVLVSSHRYIGTTSWLSHLLLAGILLIALAGLLLRAHWRHAQSTRRPADWTIWISVLGFALMAVLAAGALLLAHARQWLGVAKTSEQKPFFETVALWADSSESLQLRQVFARWDVDGYSLVYWLLPFVLLLGLVGGFSFMRKALPRAAAVAATGLTGVVCLLLAWHGGWLSERYAGSGVLSQHVVAVLPWLDATLLAALFLLLACSLWCLRSVWRSRKLGTLRHTGSLALIHGGAVLVLVGGFAATALNSYMPILLQADDDLAQWRGITDGMQVRVVPASSVTDYSGYQAVARVEVQHGQQVIQGQALFKDGRELPPGYQGPVRQLCEILDYRYARHKGDPGYILNPFIIRNWLEDTQVWVPASPRLMASGATVASERETLIVVRRYPLVSLLWIGFVAMLLGTLLLPGWSREKRT
ncbi:cytochrome c biogenesis protein CcsA [Ectopseudomonas mendocina]|uniref:Cytochrome c biogenesis protein CcsA n=1 Tax=Ectopseudomonas mendocina TaxID=300 RepID=A0ABZ2RI93_ECTME